MVKGSNLRVQELEDTINEAIEKAQLPSKVLAYIFSDYANQYKASAVVAIEYERKAYEEGVKEDGIQRSE